MADIETMRTVADFTDDVLAEDMNSKKRNIQELDARTRAFGPKSSTTMLGTGTIGYYGGYDRTGTLLSDGTVTLSGTADRYIYMMPDGSVTFAAAVPSSAFPMIKVPYSAGWQTPVDIRPQTVLASATASGGDLALAVAFLRLGA